MARLTALPRRKQLMIGGATAVTGLLAVFLFISLSGRSTPPVGQEVGVTPASVPPAQITAQPISKPPLATPQPAQTAQVTQPQAESDDLKAMLAMKTPPHPVVRTPDAAPIPTSPAAIPSAQKPDATPVRSTPPEDAVHKAARLQAAPMTPDDQVQVLQLVTEEAALVQRTRSEIEALRQDLDRLRISDTAKSADLNRRMSLLEAKKAVADAEAPPSDGLAATRAAAEKARAALEAALAEPHSAATPAKSGTPAPSKVHETPLPPPATWTPHYRILAASPQLAMVQDDGAPAGQGSQSEVQIGTDLRGYGRVRAISQRGTLWVIQAEHGTIQ
ncbi:hypothetical protein CFR75_11300 [Komagataeibacter xylinus]|uniref:Uncharacterized protein n=1 Tax=Komagataeibacter xylinus TaxID=28448 RepID=A0A318PHJ1_KOMXY|nr:hypothetical protein CFR75_11300 [Komagataeibacter xylinus]